MFDASGGIVYVTGCRRQSLFRATRMLSWYTPTSLAGVLRDLPTVAASLKLGSISLGTTWCLACAGGCQSGKRALGRVSEAE